MQQLCPGRKCSERGIAFKHFVHGRSIVYELRPDEFFESVVDPRCGNERAAAIAFIAQHIGELDEFHQTGNGLLIFGH
jgi:hypothetical protein